MSRETVSASDQKERGFDNRMIPVMREAVAIMQMILFFEVREDVASRYSDWPEQQRKQLAGAIVNDVFGDPARDAKAWEFAGKHRDLIEKELKGLAARIPDLLGHLTDALRMQTICDNQEGVHSIPTLLRARVVGILQEDRTLPMPSTFMISIRNLGARYGLVESMQTDNPDQA